MNLQPGKSLAVQSVNLHCHRLLACCPGAAAAGRAETWQVELTENSVASRTRPRPWPWALACRRASRPSKAANAPLIVNTKRLDPFIMAGDIIRWHWWPCDEPPPVTAPASFRLAIGNLYEVYWKVGVYYITYWFVMYCMHCNITKISGTYILGFDVIHWYTTYVI